MTALWIPAPVLLKKAVHRCWVWFILCPKPHPQLCATLMKSWMWCKRVERHFRDVFTEQIWKYTVKIKSKSHSHLEAVAYLSGHSKQCNDRWEPVNFGNSRVVVPSWWKFIGLLSECQLRRRAKPWPSWEIWHALAHRKPPTRPRTHSACERALAQALIVMKSSKHSLGQIASHGTQHSMTQCLSSLFEKDQTPWLVGSAAQRCPILVLDACAERSLAISLDGQYSNNYPDSWFLQYARKPIFNPQSTSGMVPCWKPNNGNGKFSSYSQITHMQMSIHNKKYFSFKKQILKSTRPLNLGELSG